MGSPAKPVDGEGGYVPKDGIQARPWAPLAPRSLPSSHVKCPSRPLPSTSPGVCAPCLAECMVVVRLVAVGAGAAEAA